MNIRLGRRRREEGILSPEARCIFCAGNTLATTWDHQPARILFNGREGPKGYSFPACEICNRATRQHEQVVATIARLSTSSKDDIRARAEIPKIIKAMNNNFPDLISLMRANQKREYFRRENVERPRQNLTDLPMVKIDETIANASVPSVVEKMARAFHFFHTDRIVPPQAEVVVHWMTNAYFHRLEEFGGELGLLNKAPVVTRNNRDLSDQFDYRFNLFQDGSAFLMAFRRSLIAIAVIDESGAAAAH